jgi:hypothetical protein
LLDFENAKVSQLDTAFFHQDVRDSVKQHLHDFQYLPLRNIRGLSDPSGDATGQDTYLAGGSVIK